MTNLEVTNPNPPSKMPPPVERMASPTTLPNVFEYQDYRLFLQDTFKAKRRAEKKYSLEKFAKALGFSSHSGLAMILHGKRELRDPYLEKCVKFLKLNLKQRLYFDAMVRAGTLGPEKRKNLLRETQFYTTTWTPPETSEGLRMVDFGVVQQVLSLYRGYVSLKKIMAHFRYEVSEKDVKAVLEWMAEKRYVDVSPEGFRVNKSVLLVQDEIPNASGKQLHRDCLKLAAAALDEDPIDRREFQTYFLTMDSKRIGEMKQKIKKMVIEAISEFETELEGDTVTQVHFNLFEITRRINGNKGDQ